MTHKEPIIFVDDEANILKYFKLEFCSHYDITTFTNAHDALEYLASNPVSLIISDQRMPGMCGADFLTQVKIDYPDTQRIIATAYEDRDRLIQCINEADVHGFLEKPFEPEKVFAVVNKALDLRTKSLETSNNISKRLGDWRENIIDRRIKDLDEIFHLLGFSSNNLLELTQSLLGNISEDHETNLIEASLFDDGLEQKFVLLLLNQLMELSSLNESDNEYISFESAQEQLNSLINDNVTNEAPLQLSRSHVFLIANLERLLDVIDPKSSDSVKTTLTTDALVATFESSRSFGDSVLDPSCDQTDTTVIKNALLIYLIQHVSKFRGELNLENNKNKFAGSIIVPLK